MAVLEALNRLNPDREGAGRKFRACDLMVDIVDQIRKAGWLAVEAGLLIVILCVLLNIIVGPASSGDFVAAVAANANTFLQGLPSGTVIGLVLVFLAYWIMTRRGIAP